MEHADVIFHQALSPPVGAGRSARLLLLLLRHSCRGEVPADGGDGGHEPPGHAGHPGPRHHPLRLEPRDPRRMEGGPALRPWAVQQQPQH